MGTAHRTKTGDRPMDAAQSVHPTDQTLSSFGLGKLDDRAAEAVNEHLMECSACRKRVAEISSDSFLNRSATPGGGGQVALRTLANRRGAARPRDEDPASSSAEHTPPGPGRPPRLRDQAGARPGRHGRGLPGPQHADGPRRGAQGDGSADHGAPRSARALPPRDPGRRPGSGTRTS